MNDHYFIVWRGQNDGPYTHNEIKMLFDQGKLSNSHRIQTADELLFVGDFIEKKNLEIKQAQAAQQAQIQEAQEKAAHERQKELMTIQAEAEARKAEAEAQTAQAQADEVAALQQQINSGPAPQSNSSILEDIVGGIVGFAIVAGLLYGGWVIYEKNWGNGDTSSPGFFEKSLSISEIESQVKTQINLQYILDGKGVEVTSLILQETSPGRYSGPAMVKSPILGSVSCDVTVAVENGEISNWQISVK